MHLEIRQRFVGGTAVLECAGRIILGDEAARLQSVVAGLVAERCDLVINLQQVTHIDSNGLGTLLKLVTTSRAAGTSLVFCNPTPHVQHLFKITQLYTAMEIYDSEQAALGAGAPAAQAGAAAQAQAQGRMLLCVEPSADMLVFLTGVLTTAGYEVRSTRHYLDAIVLLKAKRPDAVLLGPGTQALEPTDAEGEFRRLAEGRPQLILEPEFAAGEAGANSAELLRRVQELLS